MNKAELIEAIAERLGDKKAAVSAVEAVVDTITRAVAKGEKVAITGFGVFEKQVRGPRTVRNPATGASIKKKKTAVPKFRPGANFKLVVSGEKKLAAPAKATGAKKATAKKSASASTGTGRGAAKKTTTTGRKTTASKATAKRAPAAKKTSARGAAKTASTRGAAKKTTAKKTTAKKTATKRAPRKRS